MGAGIRGGSVDPFVDQAFHCVNWSLRGSVSEGADRPLSAETLVGYREQFPSFFLPLLPL